MLELAWDIVEKMDRMERRFTYNGTDTWTDEDGVEWNAAAEWREVIYMAYIVIVGANQGIGYHMTTKRAVK